MCCSTHWQSCRTQLHCVCMAARYALERRHTLNAGRESRVRRAILMQFPSFINFFFFFETGCQYTALAILKFVAIPLPQLLIIGWNYRHEPSCPDQRWWLQMTKHSTYPKRWKKILMGWIMKTGVVNFLIWELFLMQSVLKFVYNFKLVQKNFPKFLIPWFFS